MRRVLIVFCTLVLTSTACGREAPASAQAGAGDKPANVDLAPTAEGCRGCHVGPLSFTGRDRSDLAAAIETVLTGQRAHPPVNVPASDRATAEALAALLAEG